jgi:two-component system chemotaxis response regulator CheB
MGQPIGVLVVDDSAAVRSTLWQVLSSDPEIEVVGTAADPYIAAERMRQRMPDVIMLDIEMPRMDGLTFLRRLMAQHPLPVVICSSLAEEGCETTLRALEYGAVEIILKPRVETKQFLEESKIRICDAVKAAAKARVGRRSPDGPVRLSLDPPTSGAPSRPQPASFPEGVGRIVAVGASTGGADALRAYLGTMPADGPGTVIVQHMPEVFTAAFARRLGTLCAVSVSEARDGDEVVRGRVLIAPGNRHTLLKRVDARYYVEVRDGPLVSRHRPSVDVLFRTVARYAGKNAVGVILTGMGDDGARGLLEMKEAGADTIVQDEASSVVFGMPQEAIKLGAADKVLPLEAILGEVLRLCR